MSKLLLVLVPLALVGGCKTKKEKASSPAVTKSGDPSRLSIVVTENGFEPDPVIVPSGKPVTLVFERKTENTCAKEFILTMADGKTIERTLPMDTPVELTVTFPKAGKLGYACAMDMVRGTIVVQ
jgi:plastocyanin domain-containing protein